jgi:hypothetical protein
MAHAKGTWIKFTADARLRKITDQGVQEQRNMGEGLLIGEQAEAVIVQQMGQESYTVYFPEGQHFGWVYNYEFWVQQGRPLLELKLVPQNKR